MTLFYLHYHLGSLGIPCATPFESSELVRAPCPKAKSLEPNGGKRLKIGYLQYSKGDDYDICK
jgi:hypothetical protein